MSPHAKGPHILREVFLFYRGGSNLRITKAAQLNENGLCNVRVMISSAFL